MAKYQKYAEYKDSGVEWLGEMPAKWKVLRYKNILKIMQGMAFKSSEYVDSSSVINIRMGNIKKGGSIDLYHNTKYLPENYKSIYGDYELRQGDTIIAMTDMSPTLDFLAVPAILDCLDANSTYLLNQRVGKLILNRDYEIRFVRYLLLSENLRIQLKAKGLGTVQANMSNDDLYSSYLFCPPSVERLNIANFLDHETTKIDHLIEKQQQLIELLKEKRQAVISHAVTKGLDPNVPMKDSGVEWLGEVPEHWDIKKIKYLGSILNGYAFPSDGFTEEGIKVLKISNIQTMYLDWTDLSFVNENQAKKLEQFLVKKGDLVFALTRPIISTGIKATLMDLDEKILLNQRNAILRPNGLCIQKWLYYMILNQNFVQEFNNQIDKTGQQPNISTVAIGNLEISVAPIEEQIKIVEFIAEKVECIDDLIKKAESAIQLMQERRTALISAAVTGKIDVRNWQAPTIGAHTELSV